MMSCTVVKLLEDKSQGSQHRPAAARIQVGYTVATEMLTIAVLAKHTNFRKHGAATACMAWKTFTFAIPPKYKL
eukprot:5313637-Amphidinium_carterae.1